ncbi:MAG: substrate-binding domain-containing protein [Thermoleophilia bacterium]|nr:substrate-binding domain-containing protein [Thermoleophilia bacterium]
MLTSIVAGGVAVMAAVPALGATSGSGATFPQLVYRDWCQQLGCSYTGKGSSGGIRDFIAGTVDFAGTDAIMTGDQASSLASQRGGVKALYFPTLLGAISIPTNTPSRLRLDGPVLGQIFSGVITKWSDARIKKLNPGKSLSGDITVCVRADGSGTSNGFSLYLEKVSKDFKSRVGNASQSPNWTAPKLVKAPGNPGVAQCVKDNAGSIGYVDLGDATNAGLASKVAAIGKYQKMTRVVKRGGKRVKRTVTKEVFILPSPKTISAAAQLKRVDLTNPYGVQRSLVASPAVGAYPITITTFILAYSDYSSAGKSGSLGDVRKVLNYAYGAGQSSVSKYGFAPLPAPFLNAGKAQLSKISK